MKKRLIQFLFIFLQVIVFAGVQTDTVSAEGTDESITDQIDTGLSVSNYWMSYRVAPGSDKTLQIKGVTIDEKYKDSLTYRWKKYSWNNEYDSWDWSSEEEINGIDGTTYTIKNIRDRCLYKALITDSMDNTEEIYFEIKLDSGLKARAKSGTINVKSGGSATLEVIASAYEGVDINYLWYEWIYNDYDDDTLPEAEYREIENANDKIYTVSEINENAYYECEVITAYGDGITIFFDVCVSETPINVICLGDENQFIRDENIELSVELQADSDIENLKTEWRKDEEPVKGQQNGNIYSLQVREAGNYEFWAWCENEDGEITSEASALYCVLDLKNAKEMPEDNKYILDKQEQKLYKIGSSILETEDMYLLIRSEDNNEYDVYITLFDSDLNVIVNDINLWSYEGITGNYRIPISLDTTSTYYMNIKNICFDGQEKFQLDFVSDEIIYECTHPESSRMIARASEPTCSECGYTGAVICNECGECVEYGDVIPMVDHTLINGKETRSATCVESGIMTYVCGECGEIITKTIPTTGKHQYGSGVINKAATTTEKGEKQYTCSVCGNTYTEELPMLKSSEKQEDNSEMINDEDNNTDINQPGTNLYDVNSNATYIINNDNAVGNPTITYAESSNKKAVNVTIPNEIIVDGTKYTVTRIAENAFSKNTKLKKVTVSKNVSYIGKNAFTGCSNLTSVTLKGNNLKTIEDGTFKNCKKLGKFTVSKNVTKIGNNAFSGCKKLSKMTIKSTKLKSIGKNAIKGINKKTIIKVPKKQLTKYKKLFTSKTGYKKTMKIKK